MVRLLVTTPTYLSQIAKKELAHHHYHTRVLSPSILILDADIADVAYLNMRSRVANRIYIVLAESKVTDFESYFQLISHIDRSRYIPKGSQIHTFAGSIQSILHHTPSLQSLSKKAIIRNLTGSETKHWTESDHGLRIQIQSFLLNDQCYICLDTSGHPLHQRGYRLDTGYAPLKENLASALILMSNWTYHLPLYDICCGSGTICIEGAMIAKNIAPGSLSTFAFEQGEWYDPHIIRQIRQQAFDHKIEKTHTIIGSDCDPDVLDYARTNMNRLGLGEIIQRIQADCQDYSGRAMQGSLICNPPYGARLHSDNIKNIYHAISRLYITNANLTGGCITGYEYADQYFQTSHFQPKSLHNGTQIVTRYQKN